MSNTEIRSYLCICPFIFIPYICIMEKEFISYQLASRMKALKFDEHCFGYYETGDENLVINFSNFPLSKEQKKRAGLYLINNSNSSLPQWAVSAPTWQQAFRWFREKYGLDNWVYKSRDYAYFYSILKGSRYLSPSIEFTSYEEAELQCLQNLIEIIEQK